MPQAAGGARPPRADARRNRDHILDVAEQYFAEHGVRVPLDGLAKRAGVGAATLYRHFPTREDLVAALLSARDDELMRRLKLVKDDAADAGEALHGCLMALVDWASAFDGLPEPLCSVIPHQATPLGVACGTFVAVTENFLVRAQAEGSARADIRPDDLFLMALAISWARGAAAADDKTTENLGNLVRSGWSTRPDA